MSDSRKRTEKKPYEKPRVHSSEAFQVAEAMCTLFMVCTTSES